MNKFDHIHSGIEALEKINMSVIKNNLDSNPCDLGFRKAVFPDLAVWISHVKRLRTNEETRQEIFSAVRDSAANIIRHYQVECFNNRPLPKEEPAKVEKVSFYKLMKGIATEQAKAKTNVNNK